MSKEELLQFALSVKERTEHLDDLDMMSFLEVLLEGKHATAPVYLLAHVASEMNAEKCIISICEDGHVSLSFEAKEEKKKMK